MDFTKQVKIFLTVGLYAYAMFLYFSQGGIFGLSKRTITQTIQARNLEKNIIAMNKEFSRYPKNPVAIWIQDPNEFSYGEGLGYYFKAYGLKNPIFLEITNELKKGDGDLPIDADGIEVLYNARILGFLSYTPWSKIREEFGCFAVGIKKAPEDLKCQNMGKLFD